MNVRMGRVYVALMLPLAAIVVLLTWWQVLDAGALRDKGDNQQSTYYAQRIQRGRITLSGGTVLARSVGHTTKQGDTVFTRVYPQGSFAADVVGYYTTGRSSSGIEQTQNDYLTGSNTGLANIENTLRGSETVKGDDVQLTLDADAQRIAERELAKYHGALVALDPRSGRVLAMASSPTYNPNDVQSLYGQIASRRGSPLLNRATQARYTPGSTFKLITAAAAIQDGVATPATRYPGGCTLKLAAGPSISNDSGECVPPHDLTYALTHSVNITFARVGVTLGQQRLEKTMDAFGFGSQPQFDDLPSDQLSPSGLFGSNGQLLPPDTAVDVARVAIGQERLGVTPLQMAQVAATIADGGTMMEPFLVSRVTDSDGHVVQSGRAHVERSNVISADTAQQLTEMMKDVVREGTGTAASLRGISVAGKTGTADSTTGNQVWFVAFAPADDPKVAIAVTMESQPSGTTGGVVAAPIAHDVLQSLLGGGADSTHGYATGTQAAQ